MRLIDADTLKEAIKSDIYVVDYGVEGAIYGMFWSGIEYEIDKQPTVEKKMGKWVRAYDCDCFQCNQCRTPSIVAQPYCCICGAKMEVQND